MTAFFEAWTHAARKRRFIKPRLLFWWRMPAVHTGLMVSIAAVILSFLAYRHQRQHQSQPASKPSQTVSASSQIGPPVAVAASPQPAPTPTQIPTKSPRTVHTAVKKTETKPPTESVVDTANEVPDSTLNIQVENRFSTADLSLWVDDKLAYDHSLRAQTKKHWNPFRADVRETETVRLAAGQHRLMIRVRSAPEKYEQSASILGSFAKDHPAILQISFDRQGKAMRLALR